MLGTVTFSAKRSDPHSGVHNRCAVGVSTKKFNSHSRLSKYGWSGLLPFVQKGQTHTVGYAIGAQYAVGVSTKRPTRTVDLANMGGGDCYLLCKKVKPTQWVCNRCAVGVSTKKFNSHSGLSKYGWSGTVTFCAKRSNPHSGVCNRCAVCSRC